MSAVQLREIEKRFASHLVLDSLSLDVRQDEYLVLLGQSGCGKSTTLRVIAGIESPNGGRVMINAVDVTQWKARKRDVSLMFQGDGLYPHMTIRETLAYPMRGIISALETDRRIAQAAQRLQLASLLDRRPEKLSGGELRRAGLAKSVVRQAAVRLLDEPLSALDGVVRHQFQQDLIRWHREIPGTTIHVTHDGDEAMRIADRIAVMHAGKIVQVGTPEEIYHHPCCIAVARSLGSPPMNVLSAPFCRDQLMSLWPDKFSVNQQNALDDDILVAIRPEHFAIANDSPAAGMFAVKAVCRWRQVFGGRCQARFELANRDTMIGDHVNAILEHDCGVQVGDSVTLQTPRYNVQLFRRSGERLEFA
ncbi:sugar ABC transporter, ATP-binding protein [Rhodopirellula maiorica SM1]|uniref:Sugar ABC transporter, ATP-binding protein n=1 Tax=Rhodopirellula maiorica SM1 TaxID=1265738 RepID=M5RNW8_9BACT|nr:ABC transporter ATP-binding protein [Rhodopirellula maiorica]EMI17082.1 sugar ABC transporter, ATP-binding protein [Rhodopirellula maiorica SM1]